MKDWYTLLHTFLYFSCFNWTLLFNIYFVTESSATRSDGMGLNTGSMSTTITIPSCIIHSLVSFCVCVIINFRFYVIFFFSFWFWSVSGQLMLGWNKIIVVRKVVATFLLVFIRVGLCFKYEINVKQFTEAIVCGHLIIDQLTALPGFNAALSPL